MQVSALKLGAWELVEDKLRCKLKLLHSLGLPMVIYSFYEVNVKCNAKYYWSFLTFLDYIYTNIFSKVGL